MDIRHAVLLGEIVSPGNRRTDVIMREPFEFTVDPADLLGEEAPPEDSGAEG